MDLKTLEYMEERVEKARKIVGTIEILKKNINDLSEISNVKFYERYSGFIFDSTIGDFTEELKAAYKELAEKKISQLEQALAEL